MTTLTFPFSRVADITVMIALGSFKMYYVFVIDMLD